tara:strand:+ start:497 stop:1210 length:714 start_codon:yes stop_codon:yes gene_type:complete
MKFKFSIIKGKYIFIISLIIFITIPFLSWSTEENNSNIEILITKKNTDNFENFQISKKVNLEESALIVIEETMYDHSKISEKKNKYFNEWVILPLIDFFKEKKSKIFLSTNKKKNSIFYEQINKFDFVSLVKPDLSKYSQREIIDIILGENIKEVFLIGFEIDDVTHISPSSALHLSLRSINSNIIYDAIQTTEIVGDNMEDLNWIRTFGSIETLLHVKEISKTTVESVLGDKNNEY